MNFADCIRFANENRSCFIATLEGDQPRVRPIGLWYADETGFYIQTQSVKAFAKQMSQNPNIEICFYDPKAALSAVRMLRVSGKVRPVTDLAMREKCINERGFLKDLGICKPEDPMLAIFHLYTGEAYFWSGADSMKEASIPRIKF
jgi:pyridoxamine 5'-phosphate oxidase